MTEFKKRVYDPLPYTWLEHVYVLDNNFRTYVGGKTEERILKRIYGVRYARADSHTRLVTDPLYGYTFCCVVMPRKYLLDKRLVK